MLRIPSCLTPGKQIEKSLNYTIGEWLEAKMSRPALTAGKSAEYCAEEEPVSPG